MGHNKFNLLTIWWIDFFILNVNSTKFLINKINNYHYFLLDNSYIYIYFLLNRNHINTLLFINLDSTILKDIKRCYYTLQTVFFDYKMLLITTFNTSIMSITTLYNGNVWLERELKEMNNIEFLYLTDTRKLLSNYTYDDTLLYNNYNIIINEVLV